MSEETYTCIAQAVVLIVFVLGLLYADPAAPASAQPPARHDDRHIPVVQSMTEELWFQTKR